MCGICGCGSGEARIGSVFGSGRGRATPRPDAGAPHAWRPARTSSAQGADSAHPAPAPVMAELDTAQALAGSACPAHPRADAREAAGEAQLLRIERDILGKNDRIAAANRAWLAARGIFALNLMSSPGSGKTSLLVRTLETLAGRIAAAVIEGDQQTEFDAERIRATGVPALQINTGKGCHLDADMVARALPRLPLAEGGLLLIENVGNLVCPAAFDLGETHKVVILSVTEGEDKPLKYPDMFAAADLMLLNKTDLLPYLRFDVERTIDYARRVNPKLQVILSSATQGEGMDAWLDWIERGLAAARAARQAAAASSPA